MIKISNNKLNLELKKFLQIYKNRPIKDNKGGMKINHMFGLFVLLKKLKPKYIIESGVFKGQGTWLIEKTLPKSKIYSIDIDLTQREYISNKAIYLNKDFKFFDRKIIPEKTLAFFDDHTCSIDRIKQCKFINIKQIIFEDNYDIGDGDRLLEVWEELIDDESAVITEIKIAGDEMKQANGMRTVVSINTVTASRASGMCHPLKQLMFPFTNQL